jgi:fatty acid desaturase
VVLYWLLPLLYGFPVANWFCELLEHFPYPVTRRDEWLWHTRQRAVGPVTSQLVSIMNEGHHWTHHQFPRIPFWNMRKAMRRLSNDLPAIAELMEEQGAARWRPLGLTRQLKRAIDEATTLAAARVDETETK